MIVKDLNFDKRKEKIKEFEKEKVKYIVKS